MGRTLLACLVVCALAAGCLGGRSNEATANDTTPPSTTTTKPLNVSGFTILGPTITPGDGRNRSLHEDDVAHVKYSVRNDQAVQASYYVSYIQNGVVADTGTVRLGPGEQKDYEQLIQPLRDQPPIKVEVRAGSQSAKAEASITPWPRTGETLDLGPMSVRVERWLKDDLTGETIVNVTVNRKSLPDGDYRQLRAHILCADLVGNVTEKGDARPELPEPGNASFTDLRLPGCQDVLYGVALTARDAADHEIYQRVLFVERGWRPTG